MSLSPSQRVHVITEIARRLGNENWTTIDLTLRQFGLETTDYWQGNDRASYVIEVIERADDGDLIALSHHLGYEPTSSRLQVEPSFWEAGFCRVFISHLAKFRGFVAEVQHELLRYGMSSFVAHNDIEPTAEWLDEIELALATCDAMLVLLHPGFHDSDWTDQEIGYAMGRGIMIATVSLGTDPYGFIGRFQALDGQDKTADELAGELFRILRHHRMTHRAVAHGVVECFCQSGSYRVAKRNMGLLEQLAHWDDSLSTRVRAAVKENPQIHEAWGWPNDWKRLSGGWKAKAQRLLMSEARMLGVATGESTNFDSCRDQAGTKPGPSPASSWYRVALPALQLLVALGYTPLSQADALRHRGGRRRNVLLDDILTDRLLAINRFTYRGRPYRFDLEDAHEAIRRLHPSPNQVQGLRRTNQEIYDLLVLGTSITQKIAGDSKSYSFRYIDWDRPANNVYHVTAEMEVERTGSFKTRRLDVVAFVNGIPFVVIENKRPTESVQSAGSQLIGYQNEENIPHFFHFAHLLLALNRKEARYGTVGTAKKFWQGWRETDSGRGGSVRRELAMAAEATAGEVEAGAYIGPRHTTGTSILTDTAPDPAGYEAAAVPADLRVAVNRPLTAKEATAVYSGDFAAARPYFEASPLRAPAPSPPKTTSSTLSAAPTASSTSSAGSPSSTPATARSPATSNTSPSAAPCSASNTLPPTAPAKVA